MGYNTTKGPCDFAGYTRSKYTGSRQTEGGKTGLSTSRERTEFVHEDIPLPGKAGKAPSFRPNRGFPELFGN